MPLAWLASAAIKYGPSLYQLGRGLFGGGGAPGIKRSPLETGYIEELQRRSREGVLTPGMQQEVISQVSGRVSEVGARQKADVYGQLTRQGLETSIVAQYATKGIDRDVLTKVSEVAREIALRNQMSKVGAQDVLGGIGLERTREEYQARLVGWQQRQQDISGGITGLSRQALYGSYYDRGGGGNMISGDFGEISFTELLNLIQGSENPDAMTEYLRSKGYNL